MTSGWKQRKHTRTSVKNKKFTAGRTPNTIIKKPYDEKSLYPISGNGWVVEKIKYPTYNKGSQVMWLKRFKTKKEAYTFYNHIIHHPHSKISESYKF